MFSWVKTAVFYSIRSVVELLPAATRTVAAFTTEVVLSVLECVYICVCLSLCGQIFHHDSDATSVVTIL